MSNEPINYEEIADLIYEDDQLLSLLKQVLRYWSAVTHSSMPRSLIRYIERWGRDCEEVIACPELYKALERILPDTEIMIVGVSDLGFYCILANGKPVGILPAEFGRNPFEITINQIAFCIHETQVEIVGLFVFKTGNSLMVKGAAARLLGRNGTKYGRYAIP